MITHFENSRRKNVFVLKSFEEISSLHTGGAWGSNGPVRKIFVFIHIMGIFIYIKKIQLKNNKNWNHEFPAIIIITKGCCDEQRSCLRYE